MVLVALGCAAVLIATAALAVVIADAARARLIVYGVCLIASLALLSIALLALLGFSARPSVATLPLGLPWLGAHFRLDALSAFFLAVVNLGAAAASLFALGYGRHEDAPRRVLPFYPAFLAGMSIVVLADDAFTFLVSWEFMSLSSWALVMAHHRVADNVRAGYVYLIMASFGTLALLLTFGLLAGADGTYAFADIRGAHPSAALAASILILALIGAGSKAGLVPLHAWLPLAHPAAPSQVSALMSGVMTKVAVYGFVRIAFDLIGTPAWWWSMVVLARRGHRCHGRALRADATRPQAAARVSHRGEHRDHFYRTWPRACLQGTRHGVGGRARAHGGPAPRLQSFGVQEPAVLRRRGGADQYRGARHGAPRGPHPSHAADGFRFSRRLRGNLGAAAAQRLRLGMVDLPGDFAQPTASLLGPQAPGAGGGRAACTLRGACRGLLRQGIRRDLSRPRPHVRGRARARNRPFLSRCNVLLRRALPRCRHPAGLLHRCTGAGDGGPGGRPHAGARKRRLALDRADRGEPQLL